MNRPSDVPAFDPNDPIDAAAEAIRTTVVGGLIKALKDLEGRHMPPREMLGVTIIGGLTAVVGAAFTFVPEEDRDAIMEAVSQCLPHARICAEGLLLGASDDC